ncbi:SpaA isopeptide-forming pilin-related protein [Enterococcus crotali]|uniref:SpaA isopeptide-forming pilin-related protein n=1 Tax=Enterococcus crotali TaxID=1453587 RepID=UPI0004709C54|nr:SpaA isopeptide-forming pilin-related protein [Enterococcus crotali]
MHKKVGYLLLIITLILPIFFNLVPMKVEAAGRDISHSHIKNISIDPMQAETGDQISIEVAFDNSAGDIKNGDYLTLSWPQVGLTILEGYEKTFYLTIDGVNVGTVHITTDGAVATFNENIENIENIKGGFNFEAVVHNDNSQESTETIYINGGQIQTGVNVHTAGHGSSGSEYPFLVKSGVIHPENPEQISWDVSANLERDVLDGKISIIDQIRNVPTDHQLIPESFRIILAGRENKDYIGLSGIEQFLSEHSGAIFDYDVNTGKIEVVLPYSDGSETSMRILYKTQIINNDVEFFTNDATAEYRLRDKDYETQTVSKEVENINVGSWIEGSTVGKIELQKVSSEDSTQLLEGAIFDLIDPKDNSVIEQLVTDELGKATSQKIEFGEYILQETKAPVGFELDPTPVKVTLEKNKETNNTAFITLENTPEQPLRPLEPAKQFGGLKIIKKDSENNQVLKDAVFELKNEAGETVESGLTTNDQGIIEVAHLPIGTYQIIETKAPKGYQLDTKSIQVNVQFNETVEVTVLNNKELSESELQPSEHFGAIKVIKKDREDLRVLKGAVFELKNASGEVVEDDLTTNEQGIISVSHLAVGEYELVEVKAPKAHRIEKTPIHVTVKFNETTEITVFNSKEIPDTELLPSEQFGALKVIKKDQENQQVLEGAVFDLKNEAGEVVKSDLTTNEKGIIEVAHLPIGSYELIETKAPKNYQIEKAPIQVTVKFNETTEITVFNSKEILATELLPSEQFGSLKVIKKDQENQQVLEGAVFDLKNEAGEVVKSDLTTNEKGIIEVAHLPIGSYELIETKAPKNYQVEKAAVDVTVKYNETTEITVFNSKAISETELSPSKQFGFLKVIKKDKETQEVLQDAVFDLQNEAGEVVKSDLTTNEEGIIEVSHLPIGRYRLIETKAPTDYQLEKTSVQLEVKYNETTEVTVFNSKKESMSVIEPNKKTDSTKNDPVAKEKLSNPNKNMHSSNKEQQLPRTGETMNTLVWLLGIMILITAVSLLTVKIGYRQ